MREDTLKRSRDHPIDLLARSFIDEIVEFVKLIPFVEKFVPIFALLVMSRPMILAAVAITPAASAFLANNGLPPIKESVLGLVCLCFAVASAHIFNDFCDAEVDRLNRRTQLRPIVLGLIKRKTALAVSILLAVLSLVIAFFLNLTCILLLAAGIFLIFAYSARLKRTQIGFLPPAMAAFLIPPGAFAAYDPTRAFCKASIVIGLAGFFFELVPYWSQTLPDVQGDGDRGLRTISVCYGERKAAVAIFLSFIICLIFLLYLHRIALLSTPYFLFTAIGGGLLSVFLLWFIFRPDARNALISYFSSLLFIGIISLIIIIEMALPTLIELKDQLIG